jgi:uncharacterized membrane protein
MSDAFANAPLAALLGWVLFILALLLALRHLRPGFLPDARLQHAWLAGVVCVALAWQLQARLAGGISVGLLGAPLYVLLFGFRRGLLGLALALVLHAAVGHGDWELLGLRGVFVALLPALLTAAMQAALACWLPRNVFIFIIGNGTFVTFAAAALSMLAHLALRAALDSPAVHDNAADWIAYTLLMAWSEALLSGMLLSALVIYRPHLVMTYRQDLYLPPRHARP